MMWGGPKSKEISAWSGVFEKKSVVSAGTVGKSRRCARVRIGDVQKACKTALAVDSESVTLNPKWGGVFYDVLIMWEVLKKSSS